MRHPILPLKWRTTQESYPAIPFELRAWLLDPGSLTQRLRDHSDKFQVRIISQHWAKANYDEKKYLNLWAHERVMIREVELICDDQVCVSTHSVFPQQTMQGPGRQLQYLNEKPLIEILSSDRLLQRSEFQIVVLNPGQCDYERATKFLSVKPKKLWARRSIFYFYHKPLLVSEIFLPAVLKL